MSKVKVLIVDDASFIRDLVKKGLRACFPGIEIDDAADGRKAQQLLAHSKFDLILCDWEMPEMSGLELLNWCRIEGGLKDVPFIMVTSRSDKENVLQAIQAGVTDYIGKPFSNDQLVSKVRKALVRVGKLDAGQQAAISRAAQNMAGDSVSLLTTPKPEASARTLTAKAKGNARPTGRGQGQLRLSSGNLACIIKAISLKDALLVVKRGERLPQVMESAVLDLEHGEQAEIARLNGYLHSVAALEPKPDSEWLQLNFRFVDADPQKLDYLSRLITANAIGTL